MTDKRRSAGPSLPVTRVREPADGLPLVALHRSVKAALVIGAVPSVFGDQAASWLGQPTEPTSTGLRRYLCDLELRVGPERYSLFRKAAIVGLGMPEATVDGWRIPIEWQAATLAPLFPVLVGHLDIRSDRITLDGRYAPPFGKLGHVLDRGLHEIAAQGTARWFLAKVAVALASGA